MVVESMESMLLYGFLTVFSVGLFIVSFLSFFKSKNKKLLFVSGVFLIFTIEGIILSLSLFVELPSYLISIQFLSFLDLIVLVLLFMATLKR